MKRLLHCVAFLHHLTSCCHHAGTQRLQQPQQCNQQSNNNLRTQVWIPAQDFWEVGQKKSRTQGDFESHMGSWVGTGHLFQPPPSPEHSIQVSTSSNIFVRDITSIGLKITQLSEPVRCQRLSPPPPNYTGWQGDSGPHKNFDESRLTNHSILGSVVGNQVKQQVVPTRRWATEAPALCPSGLMMSCHGYLFCVLGFRGEQHRDGFHGVPVLE